MAQQDGSKMKKIRHFETLDFMSVYIKMIRLQICQIFPRTVEPSFSVNIVYQSIN